MRWTKLMGLAVVLVGMAAVINALAFSKATVTNPTTFTVDTTDAAGLAFDVGAPAGSGYLTTIGVGGNNQRQLVINITDVMQPNSEYTFENVFEITNNNANSVTITFDSSALPAGVTITASDASDGSPLNGTSLAAAASVTANLTVNVANTYAGSGGTDLAFKVIGTE